MYGMAGDARQRGGSSFQPQAWQSSWAARPAFTAWHADLASQAVA